MDAYQTRKLSEAVFLYLNGERVSLIQATIVALSAESEQDAKNLYKQIKVTKAMQNELFATLRVPKNQQKFYTEAPHLLALLAHLHQDGYGSGHLGHLLNIIDETKYNFYRQLRRLGLAATTLGGIGALIYLKPEQASRIIEFVMNRLPTLLLNWLMRTFSLLKNLTFIGIANTCVRYIIFLYNTFYHGFSNLSQKLMSVFFRTASTALNLSAYAMIFWTAGLATPLSAILFISASLVAVIESIAHYMAIRFRPVTKDQQVLDPWLMKADLIREENQKTFAMTMMTHRTGFALIIAAITAVWCIMVPGGIFLTLTFMAAIMIAGWLETLGASNLEAKNAIKLQKVLQEAKEGESSLVTTNTCSPVKTAAHQAASASHQAQATPSQEPGKSSKSLRFFDKPDTKRMPNEAPQMEKELPVEEPHVFSLT
jgi:hypothetical protein